MQKLVALAMLLLALWTLGIHTGKQLQKEQERKTRRARVERLTLFAKHRNKGTWYQQGAEKATNVIGEIFN